MRPALKLTVQAPERAPGKLYDNESMYSLACWHSMYSTSTRLPMPMHLSVLDPQATLHPQLPAALGVTAQWLGHARGDHLEVAGLEPVRAWLRYCPNCIAGGYHTPLYQSPLVSRCPAHGTKLLDRCHQCGARILPTLAVTERSPFECPHCFCDLRRCPPYGCTDRELAQAETAAAAVRQVLLWASDSRLRLLHPQLAGSRVQLADERVARSLQRAIAFCRPPDSFISAFREMDVGVVVDHRYAALECSAWDGQLRFMRWARRKGLPHRAVVDLCNRARRGRLKDSCGTSCPLPAAAMFLVLRRYKLEDIYLKMARGCLPEQPARLVRFSATCHDSPQLNTLLMQLELQGALATTIAAVVRAPEQQRVGCAGGAPPQEYCPSAVLDLDRQRARVRCRAEENHLLALIRRYAKQMVCVSDSTIWKTGHTADV